MDLSNTLPRIHELPSQVVDQIAAGEVVERPSHLVKELIENSLDAKAKSIVVEFSNGGRSVAIIDNGIGIHPDDLKKSISRHTTSKISETSDLWKLSSYGFRGEALASIASVSELQIISRIQSAKLASRVQSNFGKLSEVESISADFGTRVEIKNLFENVPARLKFMKSQAAEHGQIRSVVRAMALTHFSVAFKVIQEGELVFIWPAAESKLERATQVLGVEKLFLGTAERDGVKASAVFSDPNTTAKTSKNIWIFVQNRWVQDRSLQVAVLEAYRNLLMHGEYPIAAVWVDLDPSLVDVNIHPTKSQVKFFDSSMAFRAVQASIRDNLEKAPWVPEKIQTTTTAVENLTFEDKSFNQSVYKQKPASLEAVNFVESIVETKSPKGYWSGLQYLSQAHLTYLVCQSREGIVFVDQHAAHERVLFEKLMSAWLGGKVDVQSYLFPLGFDCSSEKMEGLLKHVSDLKKFGIEIEQLGPQTLGVKSAPAMLSEKSIIEVLHKMSEDILENSQSYSLEKKVADLCATMACHSAVRAGQALNQEDAMGLLQSMDEFPLSSFCPHGRPVFVNYPIQQLEKDFGRLV